MRSGIFFLATAMALFSLFDGCINLGPHYRRPELGIRVPDGYQNASQKSQSLRVADRWWEVFGNPEIDREVAQVLKNNWDIKKAAARVLEARAKYVQVSADRYPGLNGQGSFDRRRIGGVRAGSGTTVNTWELAAPASFELDLWSRLAKASRAARDEILQEQENRRTVAQSVVAETISLYLQMESLERRLQIARQSIAAFQLSLQFVDIRYRRGLTSVLDVRQAGRVLAQAEARIPELQQQLGINQQQRAILLGQYPQIRPARQPREDYYRHLAPVPPGLPSDLLRRRPDIRAAEQRLRALNERVGVAKAARFPSITLTGEYGWSSNELSGLIQPDNVFWSWSVGILQPLFDAGRLKAGQQAAEARYQQAVADYNKSILEAFSEVESALLTRQKQMERRQRVMKFVQEARAAQRVAQNRYIHGLTGYLDVLNAQQTRFGAEELLVQVDLAILSNRVSLHRALGGGWAPPPPVAFKDDGPFSFF